MPTTLLIRFTDAQLHQHAATGELAPPAPWHVLRTLYATWRTRAPHLDEATMRAVLTRLAEPPVFHQHPHELAITWPFTLPTEQHATLQRLATSIPYWDHPTNLCDAQLVSRWRPARHGVWVPLDVTATIDPHVPATAVLAPVLPLRWDSLTAVHHVSDPTDSRPLSDSAHLIGYQYTAATQAHHTAQTPTSARFELTHAAAGTATLAYTDLLRQAALSKLGTLPPGDTTCLNGKNATGTATRQQHRHAHYLPLIQRNHLTGLVIWSPSGFTPRELRALTAIDSLSTDGRPAIRASIRLTKLGDIQDIAPELAPSTPAATWHSITPFVPSRYPKRRHDWQEFLNKELAREISYRNPGLLPICEVTVTPGDWQHWLRQRPSTQRRSQHQHKPRPAAFLRITLAQPHCGPLALGELSHFGIGLFGHS